MQKAKISITDYRYIHLTKSHLTIRNSVKKLIKSVTMLIFFIYQDLTLVSSLKLMYEKNNNI